MESSLDSFSISALSGKFEVTVNSLRIISKSRGTSLQRVRARPQLILRGKRCGLSLEESREIINMHNRVK